MKHKKYLNLNKFMLLLNSTEVNMHFLEIINNIAKEEEIIMFVDMDGVIASYEINKPFDFENKRPLYNNINIFKTLSKNKNIELHILSICKLNKQEQEKNNWLDCYAPFFKKEHRHILSREKYSNNLAKILKKNFLEEVKTNKKIIVVDDDNDVLYEINKNLKNIILFQDSELID